MKQNDGGVDVAAVMTEIERFGRAYCAYVRGGNHEDLEEANRIYDGIPALLASPAAVGWQPIETAPKDGETAVLGYQLLRSGHWVIAPMYFDGSVWLLLAYHSDNTEHEIRPTHWQPLPSPPAIASQEVGND